MSKIIIGYILETIELLCLFVTDFWRDYMTTLHALRQQITPSANIAMNVEKMGTNWRFIIFLIRLLCSPCCFFCMYLNRIVKRGNSWNRLLQHAPYPLAYVHRYIQPFVQLRLVTELENSRSLAKTNILVFFHVITTSLTPPSGTLFIKKLSLLKIQTKSY